MGRKLKLSIQRKNAERNRQGKKINKIGRPSKVKWVQLTQPPTLDSLKSALCLPPCWVDRPPSAFCKLETATDLSFEVTRSVSIHHDLTWKAQVHGREIPHSNPVLKNVNKTLDSVTLQELINTLDTVKVCCGNQEQQFVTLDKTLPVSGDEGTVRTSNCDIISSTPQCASCSEYRRNLRAMVSRNRKITTPELRERLHNSMNEVRALNRRVTQLKQKLNKLTQSVGVSLDEDMHSDISTIVMENDITSEHPPDSFARIFWEQQSESMRKHPKQMRWHPMMIKWCIHLRMLSSSCYHSLRSSGVVMLPSERTLRDYTNVIEAKAGFQREVDEQLLKEASINTEHEKYVALIFDEVKVKEDLVYNKHTGALIGFVNLTNISDHLSALERACACGEEDDQHKWPSQVPQLATHMLVFMIRGICSSLKFPYTQFPVKASTGDTLHPIVWECVEHIEMLGLKVLAFVSDGASCNRKFYGMHKNGPEIPHKIKNIYAEEDRPIFLISDVPHLLKTARNSWANSYAHANTRHLWNNGQDISWQHLMRLFERHCTMKHTAPGLTILPKLKYEHVNLTSYSKMRVDLAAQVMSKTVAEAFSLEGNEGLKETEHFVRNLDRFFDCMNVRNFEEAVYKRKPDLRPYRRPDDDRLSWLENDFLSYFDQWESNVTSHYKLKYERERLLRAEQYDREDGKSNQGEGCEREDSREENRGEEKAIKKGDEKAIEKEAGEEKKAIEKGGERQKENDLAMKRKVKSRKERERVEKEKMRSNIEKSQIAKETRCGLHFTVKAIVELVRYCLNIPGVKCVLTEHLNQDPLEAFFGRHRMGCGRNDNPSVSSFLQKTVSLRVQGSAALQPFRGNCRRKKKSKRQPIPVDNMPLKKRNRK